MKQKRTYLTVPGQSLTISISGSSACGKTQVAAKLVKLFQADGLFARDYEHSLNTEIVEVTCPTAQESRDLYLETLGEHEIVTLKGHLDALGYEL